MYQIFTEGHFSAAHRLRMYHGKCERQHGHNWRVRVYVGGDTLGSGGMLLDFTLLKTWLNEVLDLFDHRDLNELPFFETEEPSAENISRIICEEIDSRVASSGDVRVTRVMVWESEKSCAIYEPD